jgi:hypothetical protein
MPVSDSNVTLNGTLTIQLQANETGKVGLVTAQGPMSLNDAISFTTGAGSGQANQEFSETATLNASAPTTVKFYGDNTRFDPLGQPLALARIKALVVLNQNQPGSGGTLTVGGSAGTSPIATLFNTTSAAVELPAGAGLAIWSLDASGFALNTSSAFGLYLDPGTTTCSYAVYAIGAQS